MSDVLPAWAALTNWPAAHAPASHATLRPGATAPMSGPSKTDREHLSPLVPRVIG